jgi:pSer/pThr/pTyr-binding forkhead associated (FHA) protein
VVDDPNVSRHHARITRETDTYLITDLGSMNGTTVNGASITRHVLNDGDTIGVGSHIIVFEAL